MSARIHEAGVPDRLVQRCARCGEILSDYRGAMGVGNWSPCWWAGNVETEGVNPTRMSTTTESATCERPACAICDKPAGCVGSYDDMPEFPLVPACDDCCGHGGEDGYCWRLTAWAGRAH